MPDLPFVIVDRHAFLVIGLALPVLPLHVHDGLGLSTFVVGLVTGSRFAASCLGGSLFRYARSQARGPRRVLTAVLSGLLYLASLAFTRSPFVSVAILVAASSARPYAKKSPAGKRGKGKSSTTSFS